MRLGRMVCGCGFAGAVVLALSMSSCGGGGGGGGGGAVLPVGVAPAPDAAATPTPPAAAPAPAPAAAAAPSTPSRVVSDAITSAKTGAVYKLDIYLPVSYDGGSGSYPVIYAMDGDAVFNGPGTRFANLRDILERRQTRAILIGIGGSARRQTDYTLPGATAYHDFLTLELVPFIEARYRADVKRRMLTGLSLSGSMTGMALLMEGAGELTFSYFLSFDGSYSYQGNAYNTLEQTMHDALGARALPATLVLTHCLDKSQCNFDSVEAMYQRLAQRDYPSFAVSQTSYATSHTGTDIPSFQDTIARLLP